MQISIIIPTLNEASHIVETLSLLQELRQRGHEVIVTDGGSLDNTVEIAKPFCDVLIQSAQGRAQQMHAGAKIANGQVLWFLHADTTPPEAADILINNALAEFNWGRFNVVINNKKILLKFVSFMMNARSCLTGICTGDQGIFVTKEQYIMAGGFPLIPLMEDIELSRRLKRNGPPACIKRYVKTSARRWEENGVFRTIFLMWSLRFLYFLGASPIFLKKSYK